MMKKLMLQLGAALGLVVALILMPTATWATAPPPTTSPTTIISDQACQKLGNRAPGCKSGTVDDQNLSAPGGYFSNLLDAFIIVAGAVAVIFIIIGAIRYLTSTGDPARIQSAKEVILYSVIGLIVALLARAIVGFVIQSASTVKP